MINAILDFLNSTSLTAWQQIIVDLVVAALIVILGFSFKKLGKLFFGLFKWLFEKIQATFKLLTKPLREERDRNFRFKIGVFWEEDLDYIIQKAKKKRKLNKYEAMWIDQAQEIKANYKEFFIERARAYLNDPNNQKILNSCDPRIYYHP